MRGLASAEPDIDARGLVAKGLTASLRARPVPQLADASSLVRQVWSGHLSISDALGRVAAMVGSIGGTRNDAMVEIAVRRVIVTGPTGARADQAVAGAYLNAFVEAELFSKVRPEVLERGKLDPAHLETFIGQCADDARTNSKNCSTDRRGSDRGQAERHRPAGAKEEEGDGTDARRIHMSRSQRQPEKPATGAYSVAFTEAGAVTVRGPGVERRMDVHMAVDDQGISLAFGTLLPRHLADLLDIAVAAYVADRLCVRRTPTAERSQADEIWQRRMTIRLPLREPDAWSSELRGRVEALLAFLTDDSWSLEFTRERAKLRVSREQEPVSRPPDRRCHVSPAERRSGLARRSYERTW